MPDVIRHGPRYKQPTPEKKGSEKKKKKKRIHWEKSNIHPSSDFDLLPNKQTSSSHPRTRSGLTHAKQEARNTGASEKKRKMAGDRGLDGGENEKGGGRSNNGPEHCKKVGQPQIARRERKEELGREERRIESS